VILGRMTKEWRKGRNRGERERGEKGRNGLHFIGLGL